MNKIIGNLYKIGDSFCGQPTGQLKCTLDIKPIDKENTVISREIIEALKENNK